MNRHLPISALGAAALAAGFALAPSPVLTIAPAAAQAAPRAQFKAGALVIEQPWLRATPSGAKVAGGYVRITNTGSEPDRLVSTSVPFAARGEVHEMTNEGGVMKMRERERGLEIGPGQSVELKPGGLHLMFMGLTASPKQGDTVRGTLTFARAGTVEVVFAVAPVGAAAPSAAAPHAH